MFNYLEKMKYDLMLDGKPKKVTNIFQNAHIIEQLSRFSTEYRCWWGGGLAAICCQDEFLIGKFGRTPHQFRDHFVEWFNFAVQYPHTGRRLIGDGDDLGGGAFECGRKIILFDGQIRLQVF